MVLPAKLSPAARKSKNISLSNLVIFSTIQILTSPKNLINLILVLAICLSMLIMPTTVSVSTTENNRKDNGGIL